MSRRTMLLTIVALIAGATHAWPQPGWTTLRDPELGFEVKHPPSWRVSRSTGTLQSVILGEPVAVGKPNIKSQFSVQRDANPRGLTIEHWQAEQLAKVRTTPGITFSSTTLGGRPAVLMEATSSVGRHFTFFTTLHRSDIFNVSIIQPVEQTQLDASHAAVLAGLKFLE